MPDSEKLIEFTYKSFNGNKIAIADKEYAFSLVIATDKNHIQMDIPNDIFNEIAMEISNHINKNG